MHESPRFVPCVHDPGSIVLHACTTQGSAATPSERFINFLTVRKRLNNFCSVNFSKLSFTFLQFVQAQVALYRKELRTEDEPVLVEKKTTK